MFWHDRTCIVKVARYLASFSRQKCFYHLILQFLSIGSLFLSDHLIYCLIGKPILSISSKLTHIPRLSGGIGAIILQ